MTKPTRTRPKYPTAKRFPSAFVAVLACVAVAALGFYLYPRKRPSVTPVAAVEPEKPFLKYGGSQSCETCHSEIYKAWRQSHHGLAERPFDRAVDAPAFEPARVVQHGTQHTSVNYAEGKFAIEANGPDNRYTSFEPVSAIGHEPLRQFLVSLPGGRRQALEAAYDPARNEWFDVYGSDDRKPGEWGHWTGRGMNWNSMCATCHNTRLLKKYDVQTDTYQTEMTETGVGCEECHGPLEAHSEWQTRFAGKGGADPTLIKHAPEQTLDTCGYCHSRREDLTEDFAPGEPLLDHARLTIVDASDAFYADGQVHEEDYEYAAFLGSKMHMRGVTCLDCHEPHSGKTLATGNALCLRCHNGGNPNAPVIDPAGHSHHTLTAQTSSGIPRSGPGSGGECVNCHMPQTAYMQRHLRHDHGFTTPDPLLTKQLAIPNACNRCHADQNPDWALQKCEEWYGEKMQRPSRERAVAIANGRAGLPGADAALTKLLATEQNPYWRAAATALLRPWADKPVVKTALMNALREPAPLVRAEAIRSLESLISGDSADVKDALTKSLTDPVRGVRIAAAWALRENLPAGGLAAADLEHTLALHADQPVGQMQLGVYAMAKQDPQSAATHYAKAVEWDPNAAPLRNDYAVVLSTLNRPKEAVAQLEEACRLEPRNADFRYRLALGWNECGDTTKTIDSLKIATTLDPKLASAWYNLGLALDWTGKREEGIAALRKAESVERQDPRIPYATATILARAGRLSEARDALRRALAIQPDYGPALQLAASLPRE